MLATGAGGSRLAKATRAEPVAPPARTRRPTRGCRAAGAGGPARNPVVYRIGTPDYRFSSQKLGFAREGLQKRPKRVKSFKSSGEMGFFGFGVRLSVDPVVAGSIPVALAR